MFMLLYLFSVSLASPIVEKFHNGSLYIIKSNESCHEIGQNPASITLDFDEMVNSIGFWKVPHVLIGKTLVSIAPSIKKQVALLITKQDKLELNYTICSSRRSFDLLLPIGIIIITLLIGLSI